MKTFDGTNDYCPECMYERHYCHCALYDGSHPVPVQAAHVPCPECGCNYPQCRGELIELTADREEPKAIVLGIILLIVIGMFLGAVIAFPIGWSLGRAQ